LKWLLRGSETTKAISLEIAKKKEIAALPSVARNDDREGHQERNLSSIRSLLEA